jgi:hypothetical protein
VQKSLEALDILGNLNQEMQVLRDQRNPTQVERDFLKSLGYTDEDISMGRAVIKGMHRQLFNKWMCDRVDRAVQDLKKSIGA